MRQWMQFSRWVTGFQTPGTGLVFRGAAGLDDDAAERELLPVFQIAHGCASADVAEVVPLLDCLEILFDEIGAEQLGEDVGGLRAELVETMMCGATLAKARAWWSWGSRA
jgi:hypothetical protein